jgi:hypothetical protein
MADYAYSWIVTISGTGNEEGYESVQVDADRLEVTPSGALVFHAAGATEGQSYVICVLPAGSYVTCSLLDRLTEVPAGFRWCEGRLRL